MCRSYGHFAVATGKCLRQKNHLKFIDICIGLFHKVSCFTDFYKSTAKCYVYNIEKTFYGHVTVNILFITSAPGENFEASRPQLDSDQLWGRQRLCFHDEAPGIQLRLSKIG